jgi:hypothetical protein
MSRGHEPAALIELNAHERRVLGRQHPQLAGYASATVVVAAPDFQEHVTTALRRLVEGLNGRQRAAVEEVVEHVLTAARAPRQRVLEEGRKQARFRQRVLDDYGSYTASEVAVRSGSRAAAPTKLVSQWRRAGRVFAVPFEGTTMYLGFQFDERGRPFPVVAEILRELRGWDDWAIAAWFVADNGLLEHRRPADLLGERPSDVLEAAHMDTRIRPDR